MFAQQAVQSDARKGRVDKLQYAFTGPWRVTSVLSGASYKLEHCKNTGRKEKKHAADLSPYLPGLIPIQPVDGADMRYGQLYKPITVHPFKEAGLKGFMPRQPFQVSTSNLAEIRTGSDSHWPSLSELNDKITPFLWSTDDKFRRYLANDSFTTVVNLFTFFQKRLKSSGVIMILLLSPLTIFIPSFPISCKIIAVAGSKLVEISYVPVMIALAKNSSDK